MPAPNNLLEVAVDELRRAYDELDKDYDQVRVKALTFLGGGLALLTFLYSGKTHSGKVDLFIPHQVYGMVFYFGGLVFVLFAIALLFYTLKPVYFREPTENEEIEKLDERHRTKNSYLVFLKEEYSKCLEHNGDQYSQKQKLLNIAFFLLVTGAIILLVLKQFGG
jgi:Ca2+/Na+ antiporter